MSTTIEEAKKILSEQQTSVKDSVKCEDFDPKKLGGTFRTASINVGKVPVRQQVLGLHYEYSDNNSGPLRIEMPRVLCEKGINVQKETRDDGTSYTSKSMYFNFDRKDVGPLKEFETKLITRIGELGEGKFYDGAHKKTKEEIMRAAKFFWMKIDDRGQIADGFENKAAVFIGYSEYKRVMPTFTLGLEEGKPRWLEDNSLLQGSRIILHPLIDVPEIVWTNKLNFRKFIAGGALFAMPNRVNPSSQIDTLRKIHKNNPKKQEELRATLTALKEKRKLANKIGDKFRSVGTEKKDNALGGAVDDGEKF